MDRHIFAEKLVPNLNDKKQYVTHYVNLKLYIRLGMIEPAPTRIWYCYGEYQPIFSSHPYVHFHEGLPQLSDEVLDGRQPSMIVVRRRRLPRRSRRVHSSQTHSTPLCSTAHIFRDKGTGQHVVTYIRSIWLICRTYRRTMTATDICSSV